MVYLQVKQSTWYGCKHEMRDAMSATNIRSTDTEIEADSQEQHHVANFGIVHRLLTVAVEQPLVNLSICCSSCFDVHMSNVSDLTTSYERANLTLIQQLVCPIR